MARTVILVILMLASHSVSANCELSWVKDWELNQNWFHTSAVYAKQEERKHVPTVLQALYKKELNYIDVRCRGAGLGSCKKITRVQNSNTSCAILPAKTKSIAGKESEMGLVLYARQRFEHCFQKSIQSDIGIVSENSILVVPDTYNLFKLVSSDANKLFEKFVDTVRELPELKQVKYSFQHPAIDISRSELVLDQALQDSIGNSVFIIAAKLKLVEILNLESAKNNNEIVSLPLVVAKINNNWLLIGNGFIGQCSGYGDKGSRTVAEQLKLSYGLPTKYVFYDHNYDGRIDMLGFTPRAHLAGTKYVYHIQKNKLILVGELCTTSPKHCRPGAGC